MSGMASLRKDTGIHILKDELGWPDKGGKNGYKKSHSGGGGESCEGMEKVRNYSIFR